MLEILITAIAAATEVVAKATATPLPPRTVPKLQPP